MKGFIQPTVKGKMSDLVELTKSKVHGLGLFATEDIPEFTKIHETHIKTESHGWINIHPNNLHNHSKEKENCIIKLEGNLRVLYSSVHIKQGEELFSDYTKDKELGFEQPEETWKI